MKQSIVLWINQSQSSAIPPARDCCYPHRRTNFFRQDRISRVQPALEQAAAVRKQMIFTASFGTRSQQFDPTLCGPSCDMKYRARELESIQSRRFFNQHSTTLSCTRSSQGNDGTCALLMLERMNQPKYFTASAAQGREKETEDYEKQCRSPGAWTKQGERGGC